MKYINLYPKLLAQIFPGNIGKNECFLFNSSTNRGFSLDGIAAIFCKKINGKKKVSEIINELETENNFSSGLYNKEIENLLTEMENNKLISFQETAQSE